MLDISPDITSLIEHAIREDFNHQADHSSLACFDTDMARSAKIVCKSQTGILAGSALIQPILAAFGFERITLQTLKQDGEPLSQQDVVAKLHGPCVEILQAERIILNFMQKLSGIATHTHQFVERVRPYGVTILDTRKTYPGYRLLDKWAVRMGGGQNHRMGLYDMIMLKDNHIDFLGGVTAAIAKVDDYKQTHGLSIPVEVEVNSIEKLKAVHQVASSIDRVMLDNFMPDEIPSLLRLIPEGIESEISGGISLDSIESYAVHRPDFISVGAITHTISPIDFSMKVDF